MMFIYHGVFSLYYWNFSRRLCFLLKTILACLKKELLDTHLQYRYKFFQIHFFHVSVRRCHLVWPHLYTWWLCVSFNRLQLNTNLLRFTKSMAGIHHCSGFILLFLTAFFSPQSQVNTFLVFSFFSVNTLHTFIFILLLYKVNFDSFHKSGVLNM